MEGGKPDQIFYFSNGCLFLKTLRTERYRSEYKFLIGFVCGFRSSPVFHLGKSTLVNRLEKKIIAYPLGMDKTQ